MDTLRRPPPPPNVIRRPAEGAPDEDEPPAVLDAATLYETVADALRTVLAEEGHGGGVPILRRFLGGKVVFVDAEGQLRPGQGTAIDWRAGQNVTLCVQAKH